MTTEETNPFGQNIFDLQCVLRNISVRLCARIESGVKQLLAIITSDGDVVLHYTYGELTPIIKRVPWFTDRHKVIQAICFDPSATWLLVISFDGSLYIIPALSLVDKKQKIDCKWSLTDITHFPKHNLTPNVLPTSIVWWQTLECNQNALVGYENGAIVLISLTDGRYLGCCNISESVKQLCLCQDNSSDTVSLLINGTTGQQWRLILEHHSTGYLWPPDLNNGSEDSTKSRLYSLKQMGVDKLQSLRQRFNEARGGNRRDSQASDTASESSHSESTYSSGPELLPHLCDTFFAPQYARNQYLFSAFYKPSSLLTVHVVDVESAPLFVHKLCSNTAYLLLTDKLIYTVNDDFDTISIVSSQLSECRLEGDSDFNSDSLVAKFSVTNEKILHIFKLVDLSTVRLRKKDDKKEKLYELPKSIDDINLRKPRIDTVVVVTTNSVYKLVISCSPVKKFVEYVTEENDLEKAEKLSYIFGLNLQQLLECCGDLLIARGSFHSGIILYKQAKVHLLKRVLKLAISADCRTLLKFVHLCLSSSKVDMSMPTKIHIGNLAVMAYTELILRFGGPVRINNIKDFMNFLCYEEYFDQILAVNVACQAGHWNIVNLLAKSRGLQPEVVSALGQILQSARAPRPTDKDFLLALSEPCLTQSLLINPQSSQVIFQYIRTNLDSFPLDVLQRLAVQLDPSQPCVLPLVARVFQSGKKYSSSLDTTIDSVDMDNPDRAVVTVKDLIETFLCVLINLSWKTDSLKFDLSFIDSIPAPEENDDELPIKKFPDLHPLDCGYEHTAVVRNNCVYTMGVSNSGCLGLGPLLTQSSPPRLVQTLSDLKVKVLSVSCGRKHTFALTDFGVYAWGSNAYGQLGLGKSVQESPCPQIITSLANHKIIEVCAGQYHSIALSVSGKVFTWGWGIHGQLGHGICNNEYYPRLLNFAHSVKQVTAGHAHSLILTCDGKLYGFGSNIFGQLESCQIDTNKSSTPVWVLLMPDIYTPIEKVATTYFHNIAIRADQEVYTWGASPQEVRLFQSKNHQRNQQNGISLKPPDSWKASVRIYTAVNKRPIEQVSVGYRHSAILHNGKILWGKNKDDELSPPQLRDQDNINLFTQRFLNVSCGLDYTMAIDHTGKLLAWGSPSMAQTILGRPFDEKKMSMEGKVAVFKNTRRIVKFPSSLQTTSDCLPIEVPGLPSMAITFNLPDHKLLLSRRNFAYVVRRIENPMPEEQREKIAKSPMDYIKECPQLKFGQKTLQYALQLYYGFYDSENILTNCFNIGNYQAASKVALLEGHFGDSLAFQLMAFREHLKSLNLNIQSIFNDKNSDNLQNDLNERNLLLHSSSLEKILSGSPSPGRILSSSSSLDSIRQWGDDVEHQGGCESPCEMSEIVDVRQNMTQYVQSVTSTDNSPPITSVSKLISENEKKNLTPNHTEGNSEKIAASNIDNIIEVAGALVEFYITKIYLTENHILMQNILLKCIEFWLTNNLPVTALENILLKNMDKYFYPLSILLFCKNYGNNDDEIIKETNPRNSACFLKEFSTKFCLQLCSMVLENVNKS